PSQGRDRPLVEGPLRWVDAHRAPVGEVGGRWGFSPGKGISLHTRCTTFSLVSPIAGRPGRPGSTAPPQDGPPVSAPSPQPGPALSTALSTASRAKTPVRVDPPPTPLLAWWEDGAPGLRTAFARGRQATFGARVSVSPRSGTWLGAGPVRCQNRSRGSPEGR